MPACMSERPSSNFTDPHRPIFPKAGNSHGTHETRDLKKTSGPPFNSLATPLLLSRKEPTSGSAPMKIYVALTVTLQSNHLHEFGELERLRARLCPCLERIPSFPFPRGSKRKALFGAQSEFKSKPVRCSTAATVSGWDSRLLSFTYPFLMAQILRTHRQGLLSACAPW